MDILTTYNASLKDFIKPYVTRNLAEIDILYVQSKMVKNFDITFPPLSTLLPEIKL